jgi:hypothetical protein
MQPEEDKIRSHAYAIWEKEGRPGGRAQDNWRKAEQELMQELVQEPVKGDRERPQPAAGPHAKPELTNEMATPGAGMLPDPNAPEDDQQAPGG